MVITSAPDNLATTKSIIIIDDDRFVVMVVVVPEEWEQHHPFVQLRTCLARWPDAHCG